MHNLREPKQAKRCVDEFGDPTFRLYQSSSDSESSSESDKDEFTGHGATRPRAHDYETFICGFFYFFVL